MLTIKLASNELVVTNRELAGANLAELVTQYGRGVTVERIVRRGDVIFASGPHREAHAAIDNMFQAAKKIGFTKIAFGTDSDERSTKMKNIPMAGPAEKVPALRELATQVAVEH